MANKPLTREEIANTEKKLDMPLDEIIKLSKNMTQTKKQLRHPNKNGKVFNNAIKEKAMKVRRYMDTRSFVRQGALAKRRSSFQGNQFPFTAESARKVAVAPFRSGPFEHKVLSSSDRERTGAFTVQGRAANRVFSAKATEQQQKQNGNGGAKPRPKTLDSRFANMKEERMKVLSSRNNGVRRRNGNGFRPMVPWARGRF